MTSISAIINILTFMKITLWKTSVFFYFKEENSNDKHKNQERFIVVSSNDT